MISARSMAAAMMGIMTDTSSSSPIANSGSGSGSTSILQ